MKPTISRRDFLKLAGFASLSTVIWGCAPEAVSNAGAPLSALSATGDDAFLFNALKRITFGPIPDEYANASQIGFEAFVEQQLAFEALDDMPMAEHLNHLTTLKMPPEEMIALEKPALPITELIQATLLRAVYSRRQLYERMVQFWSDHFNIYILKNQCRYLKTADDREVIRPHALGKFRDLLSASMHSPAMMVYLDNASSTKDGPNENYARELLELHTLGVDGGYTQTDILEVARALTGWSVTGKRSGDGAGAFMFKDRFHDDDAKHILNMDFPAGMGVGDGEQLIDLLATHPSTAAFISYKLVRHFVADVPPEALVKKTAETFLSSGGDIPLILRTIFFSDEFRASLGNKLKKPSEFVVSAIRQSGAQTKINQPVTSMLRSMGHLPFFWAAPNGYPDVGAAWLNSNDLLARWKFSLALTTNTLEDTQVNWGDFKRADEAIDMLSVIFFGAILPDDVRLTLIDLVNSVKDVSPAISAGALLLASPYFQYR